MRWAGQEVSSEAVSEPAALPGLDRLHNLVRSVRTPEFAGITFHEVLAKSALNHVPKAAGLPFNWTVNPYRGCSHGCVYCPEVLGTGIGGRDGLSPGLLPVPIGLPVVRLATSIRTGRHRTGPTPTRADLLEPSSQQTRLPLGFGCHRRHPLRKDASRLRPRPAFATTGACAITRY